MLNYCCTELLRKKKECLLKRSSAVTRLLHRFIFQGDMTGQAQAVKNFRMTLCLLIRGGAYCFKLRWGSTFWCKQAHLIHFRRNVLDFVRVGKLVFRCLCSLIHFT